MTRATDAASAPHYLRFARVLALVSAAGATGCRAIPTALACSHCRCSPTSSVSLERPVTCALIHREDDCCGIEGPLPPPELVG